MIIEVNADNFREEVVSSDELTLVDIYATWCGPCKALSPVLEEISEKYAEKIKVVKVNVDENENLAVKFGVTSVPTVLFFKGGRVVGSFVGYKSASETEKIVVKYL